MFNSHQMEGKGNENKNRDPTRELSYLIAKHYENPNKTNESCSPPSLDDALSSKVECGDSECDERISEFESNSNEGKEADKDKHVKSVDNLKK